VSQPLIDVNVTLGQWPTRRVRGDTTAELVTMLSRHGVAEAWTGSIYGALYPDLSAANAELADQCRNHSQVSLLPFGTVNPLTADWDRELRLCKQRHAMRGLRLYPGYHGYALSHPEFARLLRAAAEERLVVCLTVQLEDERMMHPLLKAPVVDLQPLAEVLRQAPGVRLVLLNSMKRALQGPALDRVLEAGAAYVEIATLERVGGVERLLADWPAERVLFGSHAPYLYIESAVLKLRESQLDPRQLQAVCAGNARALLAEPSS